MPEGLLGARFSEGMPTSLGSKAPLVYAISVSKLGFRIPQNSVSPSLISSSLNQSRWIARCRAELDRPTARSRTKL